MERRDHDRIPRHDTFWDDTLDRWIGEGLAATDRDAAYVEVYEALDTDLHELCWTWPHPFPGRSTVVSEDEMTRVTLGESGTIERFWKHKSGTPEHLGWDCDSRSKWDEVYKPALLDQPLQIDIGDVRRRWEEGRRRKKWTYLAGVEAFECIRKIIGDEQFMYMVIDDPEWIVDLSETTTTVLLRNLQAVIDVGIQPDGIWIFGDMAFKNMTFCSPDDYRDLIWPQHKRIADWAHANRMKMIFHSDHSVPPQVSWQTYEAVIGLVNRYGVYAD